MTIRVRERKRLAFAAMIKERGLTHAQTAELLHVSIDTIKAWLKPETSASSLKVPAWAPELLGFKMPLPFGMTPAQRKARKLSPTEKRLLERGALLPR